MTLKELLKKIPEGKEILLCCSTGEQITVWAPVKTYLTTFADIIVHYDDKEVLRQEIDEDGIAIYIDEPYTVEEGDLP